MSGVHKMRDMVIESVLAFFKLRQGAGSLKFEDSLGYRVKPCLQTKQ